MFEFVKKYLKPKEAEELIGSLFSGAAVTERRESVYSSGAGSGVGAPVAGGARRGPLPSDDSAYGSGTYRPYRPALAHPHPHTPPDHY